MSRALELADDVGLLSRGDLGLDALDAEVSRDRLHGEAMVAGEDDELQAVGLQTPDRLAGGGAHRIRDGEQPAELAIDRHEHHGIPTRAEILGLRGEWPWVRALVVEQRGVAEGDPSTVDLAGDAAPRDGREVVGIDQDEVAGPGPGDDRCCQRVLAALLEAGCHAQ
jgi:hypothetical protein